MVLGDIGLQPSNVGCTLAWLVIVGNLIELTTLALLLFKPFVLPFNFY